jgi:signal transduction histidine kinase
LNREPLDFSRLVWQQIDLYQPALAAHNHMLAADVQDRIMIDGDVSLMHRIMSNLFENELAHLPDGCHIFIQVLARDEEAQLLIEDDGPGFPADLRNHVFERFVKGKHSHGRGLGLAFVKAVAQAHGGSINIGDRPGGGAAITLCFPTASFKR